MGHCRPWPPPNAGQPADDAGRALLDQAATRLETVGGRRVVIDTVAALIPTGAETNADCMVRALAPLRRLAAPGIAGWLLHRAHKGKARVGEGSRGSASLPASVDTALEMHPCSADDRSDRRRLLLGGSRHEETPRRRVIEWTADGRDHPVLPETPDGSFERGWFAIRRTLCTGAHPQPAAAILHRRPADRVRPSRATLHRWLAQAVGRPWLCGAASERRMAP